MRKSALFLEDRTQFARIWGFISRAAGEITRYAHEKGTAADGCPCFFGYVGQDPPAELLYEFCSSGHGHRPDGQVHVPGQVVMDEFVL